MAPAKKASPAAETDTAAAEADTPAGGPIESDSDLFRLLVRRGLDGDEQADALRYLDSFE